MTFIFDGWHRKTIGHLFCTTSRFVHHLKPIGDLCDLEIWWMTLSNNRAPLLCYFKLCKSFQSHRWLQTGVTVRKRSVPPAQNQRYLSLVALKFHGWPWKTIGHLLYATSRFEHHFIAICEFKLEIQYGPETPILVRNRRFFSRVTLKLDR